MFVVPARSVVHATPRTRILTLDLRGQAFTFAAGQAVVVGLADGSVRRPYSIASSPSRAREDESLELLVQIDEHRGRSASRARRPGDARSRRRPVRLVLSPVACRRTARAAVAGGTGIAPLRAMLGEMLEQHPAVRPTLIYSARAPEEFAFLDEWTRLASEGQLDLHLTVTRDGDGTWSGSRGRIDGNVISSAVATPETRCLVCGPPAMVSDTVAWLRAAGVPDHRIQCEAE